MGAVETPGASTFARRLESYQSRIESILDRMLQADDVAVARLHAAMRYRVLRGGKRLRPLLVYVSGTCFGAALERLDAPAAAVELIHAYSLIHDDLPAMDDDDLRRGQPSCHRAFDEGTAVLAGDALQARAFAVLAEHSHALPAALRVEMLTILARAIGTEGMAGGQAIDLQAVGHVLSEPALEMMHRRKTGALIQASVELGAIAAGPRSTAERAALATYGAEVGLAFQIQDDILDVTGETAVLGKRAGADAAHVKPTYPSLLGLERACELARKHRDGAVAALGLFGEAAGALRELADAMIERAH
jgi:geranylgeranyl pyrophosphate synthase